MNDGKMMVELMAPQDLVCAYLSSSVSHCPPWHLYPVLDSIVQAYKTT